METLAEKTFQDWHAIGTEHLGLPRACVWEPRGQCETTRGAKACAVEAVAGACPWGAEGSFVITQRRARQGGNVPRARWLARCVRGLEPAPPSRAKIWR